MSLSSPYDMSDLLSLQPTISRRSLNTTPRSRKTQHPPRDPDGLSFSASPKTPLKVNRAKPKPASKLNQLVLAASSKQTNEVPDGDVRTPSSSTEASASSNKPPIPKGKAKLLGLVAPANTVPPNAKDEQEIMHQASSFIQARGLPASSSASDSEPEPPLRRAPKHRRKVVISDSSDIASEDEIVMVQTCTKVPSPPIGSVKQRGSNNEIIVILSDSEAEVSMSIEVEGGSSLGANKPTVEVPPLLTLRDNGASESDGWNQDVGILGYATASSPKKTYTPPSVYGNSDNRPLQHKPLSAAKSKGLPKFLDYTNQKNRVRKDGAGSCFVSPNLNRTFLHDEIIEISSEEEPQSEHSSVTSVVPSAPVAVKPRTKASRTKENTPNATAKRAGASNKAEVFTPSPYKRPPSKAAKALQLDLYAQELFKELNQHVFKGLLDGCELVWSKLLSSTAGKAHLKRERNATGMVMTRKDGTTMYSLKIELSLKVVDSEERVRNTLSHEMCHLVTWLVDGVDSPGHGSAWKAWSRKVEQYRSDIEISTCHTYEIAYKYSWKCSNTTCGHVYGRFSKSINIKSQGCGLCRSPLVALFETEGKKTAYQEFIKDNIKGVREKNPGISLGDAMKILAGKWKLIKAQASNDVDDLIGGMGQLGI